MTSGTTHVKEYKLTSQKQKMSHSQMDTGHQRIYTNALQAHSQKPSAALNTN